ncbi:AMP-binding protein [Methanococcus voltae]|uniref:Acetyl-CoA synthetase n=1 Tax=Methanococcus voltae TaxID=2188 RepID=A0A8J7RLZ3_METVO|nr:AMP-binding protein [Methanococcus voltae]MBP2171786.1 acetyl-CoA synthetase [Methanococcus voltae]MBP2201276.1 acetyl-CoA synthetase [Methanococcus voltae]
MVSLLNEYVNKLDFESYEDFKENFKINVPENFNFAYDIVDRYAKEYPDKKALVWCNDEGVEKIYSFADIKKYSDKTANFFLSKGIKKGDVVMLTLKSRYEFWFCILALHKIGAIALPATHMLTTRDIIYRAEEAQMKMVVCIDDESVLQYVDEAYNEVSDDLKFQRVSVGDKDVENWLNFREEFEKTSEDFVRPKDCETETGDTMVAYFSSGTSGFPKLIKHDYLYPLGHILTSKFWQNVQEDGLHYTVADTGWAKCLWGKLYGQWICGSAVFVYDYERFDAKHMLDKASKHGVTTFCAPPTVYRFLIKEDLTKYNFSTLKYAVTAGEPLNPEVYNKFYEYTGLKLMEGFGQTELVAVIANFPGMEPKPGSMGKTSPMYNIKLLNYAGEECDIGEEGEIVVLTDRENKPVGMFSGYHDEEKTKSAWYDGVYHTGDTAWKDEDGYLWFVGRTDDIIKSSGYKIGPFEVESALMTHPAVLECAITGVPHPVRGQVVKATIVLAKDYLASDDLMKELQNHVKNTTAPYKYPRIVEFVEELPKTISGKIRRNCIRHNDKDLCNE